jgi:hypothetical protein
MKKYIFFFAILFNLFIPLKSQTTKSTAQNNFDIKQSGFTSINQIGYEWEGYCKYFDFRTINGYLITPHVSLGIGIGYENYYWDPGVLSIMPVFLDLRCYFPIKKSAPFFYFDGGYGSILSYTSPNWLYLSPSGGTCFGGGIGLKTFISNSVFIIMDLGISFQKIDYTYLHHYGNIPENWTLGAFVFRIGLGF